MFLQVINLLYLFSYSGTFELFFILLSGGVLLTFNANKSKKITYKKVSFYTIIGLLFAASIIFVNHNHSFYDRPIAEVIKVDLEDTVNVVDMHNNEDQLFTQNVIAELQNGEEKGRLIHLTTEYSSSAAYDQQYHM